MKNNRNNVNATEKTKRHIVYLYCQHCQVEFESNSKEYIKNLKENNYA